MPGTDYSPTGVLLKEEGAMRERVLAKEGEVKGKAAKKAGELKEKKRQFP